MTIINAITEIEWFSILFVVLVLLIALIIIKIIEKKYDLNPEIKRKLFHMSMGIVMLTFPYIFTSVISVGVLGVIALIVLFLLKYTKMKNTLRSIWNFYVEGFRNMTWGRPLWFLIFLKVVILFLVLRMFFFEPVLAGKSEEQKIEHVGKELTR